MLRRANNIASLLTMGSAMLISAGAAMAGPPGSISYGGFTAVNGTITAPCPTAATSCGAAITGKGFFQRSIVVGGQTYFQTITGDTDANVASAADISDLAFYDENFVQQGGGSGIADSQSLFAAGTTANPGDFTASTAINSGWANTGGDVITLSQGIDDTANGFNLGFTFTGDGTNATSLSVTQSINLDGTDKQVFDLRQQVATSDDTSDPLPDVAGSTIGWLTGEIIQAVWMGQKVTVTDAGDVQSSGFQSYTNVTTGATASYTDQTDVGPWAYDPTFTGSAPAPSF